MGNIPAKLEFFSTKPKIIDEEVIDEQTGDKVLRVEVKWQHADIINTNNRKYKKELLQREMDRLQSAIKEGEVYGASYHPQSGSAEVDDVSHIWEKVYMNDAGECLGIAKVLPTQRGKNAQVLIKNGKIGVSSRGYGTTTARTTTKNGKSVNFSEVNEDFKLISPGDFVLTPSVPGARVRKILESQFSEAVGSEQIIEENTVDIKTVDELKKAYPELVKSVEDTVSGSVEEQVKKQVKDALELKKDAWKTEMEAEVTKQIDTVRTENESVLDSIREAITALSKIKGVIPEDVKPTGEVKPVPDQVVVPDNSEQVKALEAKNKKLQDKIDAEEAVKTAVVEHEKLQSVLKEKLNTELDKDKFKVLKVMLEKELIAEDGTINIKSADAVEETVQTAFTHLANIIAESEKSKIVSSTLAEKGVLPDPDKEEKKTGEQEQKTTERLWEETIDAGYQGTFEEFKTNVLPKLQGK